MATQSMHPISKKYAQDELKNAALGRPHYHEEIHVPPRPHEPFANHLRDTVSMFNDPDSEFIQIAKWGLKGAVIGACIGATAGMFLKNYSGFALKKMSLYLGANTFGRMSVVKDAIMPYTVTGAGLGISIYLFSSWWRTNSNHSLGWDMVTGGAILGALSASALVNPGVWYLGMWAGGFTGFGIWFTVYGNAFTNRDVSSFEIKLPGLTEEERIKQKAKDYIHDLSMQPPLKNLVNL